jgi:hypothetical protein
MALVLNVKFITTAENGAVKAVLVNEQGQDFLVGWSRGRRSADDPTDNKQLAFNRLQKKIGETFSPEDLVDVSWNFTDTVINSATASQPKAQKSFISLADAMSGAIAPPAKAKKAEPKVEGNVTAANVATKTDCGLVTPATNRPAYVQIANAAVNTVAQLNAELLESGCEVGDERKNVNALMETGSEGAKAIGAFRQDSNGAPMIQQVRAEVVDPTVMPIVHTEKKSLPSINAHKGAAPLVSGGEVPESGGKAPVVVGQFLSDKRTAMRNSRGNATTSELDPIAKDLGSLFAQPANLQFAFGNGLDVESMKDGRAMVESLKAKGAAGLNKKLVGQLAWRLGFLVASARQGTMAEGPCNNFQVALLGFGINFSVSDGKPVVNGRPVTWDLELAGEAPKAVNG